MIDVGRDKTVTTIPELLPCPFCGSEPRFVERKHGFGRYAVGCSNIDCIIFLPENVKKRELHNYASCYAKIEYMVEAWNRRTPCK